jgi:transcriptional regulator with XRE-family HTH domain
MAYADEVGERLRGVRARLGLSLQDVERTSEGSWKAAVVGSYERGDRNISASRLCELADFYGVPASDILPEDGNGAGHRERRAGALMLDLGALDRMAEQFSGVVRYVKSIQVQRGDFNNRQLSVRADDMRALAIIENLPPDSLLDTLRRQGIIRDAD